MRDGDDDGILPTLKRGLLLGFHRFGTNIVLTEI